MTRMSGPATDPAGAAGGVEVVNDNRADIAHH